MELYQLKTFVAVAAEGHLTRAAQRLHTSQPAVSAHIKALEDELKLQLFERTPRGMQLTAAGKALLIKAEAVLVAVEDIRTQAIQLAQDLTGVIRLGLHIDPGILRISELLDVMRTDFPGIEMHYLQRMTWQTPAELRAGKLDAAFVYHVPEDEDIWSLQLESYELVVAGPVAWQERLQDADWNRITAEPWVWTHQQCPFYRIAARLFDQHGRCPLKAVVADQESTIMNLVSGGAGLSLMIAQEAQEAQAMGKVFVVDETEASIPLSILCLRRRLHDPVIQAVLRGLGRVWSVEQLLSAAMEDLASARLNA
jgi:DNA-binding transcriptional LysR family regulator